MENKQQMERKILIKKILLEYINEKKFVVDGFKFQLFLGNTIVSKSNYTIEDADEWFNEKYVTLNDVRTYKKYLGQGYAKNLLEEIFNYVKNELNINIITLIVYKNNPRASNLYFKNGFEIFMEYNDSYALIKKL